MLKKNILGQRNSVDDDVSRWSGCNMGKSESTEVEGVRIGSSST